MLPLIAFGLLTAMSETPLQNQTLAGQSDTQVVRIPFEPTQWKLVWNDEFNMPGAPDARKWDYEVGKIRNNEAQYYTKNRRENARVENGKLIIEARLDNWQGNKITSASVISKGKKEFLYGRIEVRAKIPTGVGTWPAIWTLGTNIDKVGWPRCGEMDIMENVGFDPERVHANVHVDAYNHMKGNGRGNSIVTPKPWTQFHVYAVEWYPDRLEFFFDDQRLLAFRKEGNDEAKWPFDKPQYLIMNIAMGGAWGGQKGIDESLFPHRMEVDYVRYFERVKP